MGAALERHGRLDLLLNNAGGQYFVPGRGDHRQGLERGAAAERRRHAGDVRGRPRAGDGAARAGRSSTSPSRPITGCRRWPTPARRGPRWRRSLGSWPRSGPPTASRWWRSRSAASPPSRCASTRPSCGAAPPQSVPLQRLGEVEEYGWLVALLATPLGRALSGSVVTLDGALDNWTGPWPPPDLTRDGEVPTEDGSRPTAPAGSRPRGAAAQTAAVAAVASSARRLPSGVPRAKCCGCTKAFQAFRAGSIPVARLAPARDRRLRRPSVGAGALAPVRPVIIGAATGSGAVW